MGNTRAAAPRAARRCRQRAQSRRHLPVQQAPSRRQQSAVHHLANVIVGEVQARAHRVQQPPSHQFLTRPPRRARSAHWRAAATQSPMGRPRCRPARSSRSAAERAASSPSAVSDTFGLRDVRFLLEFCGSAGPARQSMTGGSDQPGGREVATRVRVLAGRRTGRYSRRGASWPAGHEGRRACRG
jgi:hypothetical protein